MTWVTDRPPQAFELDTCVTCGLCLPVCPTFRLTGDETASPRGRLTAITAVDQGRADVDDRFDEVTSFCLQCRACETACPSLVPYGSIIERARAEVVVQRPHRSRRWKRMAVGRLIPSRGLLRAATVVAALAQRARLLRFVPVVGGQTDGLRPIPLPLPTSIGGTWGKPDGEPVTFFAGCVADPWFSGTHRAAIELLVAAGHRVTVPETQTCCGALAAHAGFGSEADRMADVNIAALGGSGRIVVDVAGCGAHLQSYGSHGPEGTALAERTEDITEAIARALREDRLPVLPGDAGPIAVQDPCHLEHGLGIMEAPREILEAAGYTVVDVDRGGLCCGAAGLYQLEYPETSETLGRAKADAIDDTGVASVATANAGCEMQLRRFLADGFRIAHPVEWYWDRWRSHR